MNVRKANKQDFNQIWPIFHEIAAAGDTYAYPTDITKEQASKLWLHGVGRLPKAFCHPTKGYVDALVIYKWLG